MNQLPNTTSPTGSPFPGYPTLDLEGLFRAVLNRAWIVIAIFGLFVSVAIAYVLFIAKKTYTSSAVVYVEPQREHILNDSIRHVRNDDFHNLDALKSLEQGLVSGSVILRVIEKHDLKNDPEFLKPKENGDSYSEFELVDLVGKRVTAKLRRGTRLIDLSVTDSSPERAQILAQAFVDEFEAHMIEQKLRSTQKAKQILQNEAAGQLERVNSVEDALQAFREKHAGIQLDEGGIVEKKLSDLDNLLSNAKNERLRLQSQYEQLESLAEGDPERILEIGSYVDLDHISKLLLTRNQKAAEFVRIERQFEPTHQTYIAFKSDLDGLNQQVGAVALAVGESIRKRYQGAVDHEDKLTKSVEEQKRELLAADDVRNEFRSLSHAVTAASDTYQKLLARISETDVTEGVEESHIRLAENPLIPGKPSSPKKRLVVGTAGLFGIALGSGLVILFYLLDRSLRTRRQVEQTLGLPVLGEIPEAGEHIGNGHDEAALLVAREPHSMAAEAFRSLRMSLAALSPRSVMVASAMPGEGKSFCATNLALLQAQLGYRTLLVDADFRKPSLASMMVPEMKHSEAEAEAAEHALEARNICQKTGFPNLFVISCGRFVPNAGGLMNGEHFASMLWEAYRSFDCVIIDSSPLGMVSDALNFARYVDAVALVVRSGTTQTPDAQKAIRELRHIRAPLAGVVLNGSTEPNRARKAYYQTYAPVQNRPVLALQMSRA